jgi:YD repeat-containing protein
MQMVTASVLGSLLFFTVSFAEEEKTVGQEVEVFDETSNKVIKYCDSTMTEMCECRKGLSDNPENAVPANECVLLNIGLGRARYSALTESIMLQLNELAPNLSLYSPSGFKVVAGYAVYGVSREKNTSNVPKHVQITDPSGVITRFLFADGESVATPFAAIGNRTDGRLAMVDAEGWATAADPAYYDFYPGDGSLWRFGASPASADYLRFVFHQTPQGRVETPQDMGVEIIRDADGILRQVMTPAWLADFAVTGLDGYDLRLYPHDASCVPGARSADGAYVIAQGTVPDAVWEFRNPQPGVPRELSVTRKRGDVSETWLYRYEEAVQDFTLVYPQGVMVKRLERVYSDDRTSWTLKRTLTASDGNVVRTEQKHFVAGASGSLLMESVKDPDGLNLVKRYDYYQDPVLNGLLKVSVNDDGSWIRYEYDVQRRKTAEVMPWLDAPTNAPNNQCAVTRYGYGLFTPGDFLAYNDQRPRTEIKEICGIEVARTYHAYPTNALGQAQEIEELAAFPAAPYGHAASPRTVKTYYAAGAALPLPGRLATVAYPGGKTETYGYEYGAFNAATFAFAPDPDGGAWRETVTTSYGANSGVQALRSARVWDEKGREVLNESYVEDGAAFALIGWTRMSYDRNGKLVETAYSDGRVVSATWGANCCGKESEATADGIITFYGYNELKQKVSETKKGLAADGSDDIATLYTYDLENRVLSTAVTNIASGLGYVASRNAYDAVGRVTKAVDRLGNSTVTAYDTLVTSIHGPNGVTAVTERYLDGKTKRVLENAVVKQSYTYGVNPDGTRWTLSAAGPLPAIATLTDIADLRPLTSGLDFPWQLQAADPLGRTVATCKPGFGHTVLITSNVYDTAGRLSRTERRVSGNNESRLLDATLYAYDAAGNRVLTALDLNTNGVIDLEGPDRVTGTSSAYEKDASNIWRSVSHSWVYPEFNSSSAVTTSVQRVLLTGLGVLQGNDGVLASHSESLDVRGNATVSEVLVDRTARKLAQFRSFPTSVQPEIGISLNGLLRQTVSSTCVTNTFSYDLLARRTADIDGRGNTALTVYSLRGLVDYTENAASNRTTYGYDTLGRRTSVTDALGNITHTQYDVDGRVTKTWGAVYPVEYGYDVQGRMVSMKTFRDENGPGDETRWFYDQPTGLLTNKLYADGFGPSYAYTPAGNLSSRTWARLDPETGLACQALYAYDAAGSLLGIDYSDTTPDIAYTYDRLGNTVSVVDASGSHTLTYAPDGQMLADIIKFQNAVFTLHEAYDTLGRSSGYALSNTVDDTASQITGMTHGYDAFSHISAVSVAGIPSTFRYGWLAGSDLQQSLAMPNGVTRQIVYDPQRNAPVSVIHTNVAGIVLTRRVFTCDIVGRLTARNQYRLGDETNRLDAFHYNQRSELTGAIVGTNTYAYTFDPVGNRQTAEEPDFSATYSVNTLNQYTNISYGQTSMFAPVFDLDGNQTLLKTTIGIWHVTYNAENRPIVFSNDTTLVKMTYDYMGRRFDYKETVNGVVTRHERYLYRGYLQIAALTLLNASNVQSQLIHAIVWDPAEPVATSPLMLSTSAEWYTYSFDQSKNVTELFDGFGAVSATYDYAPFGQGVAVLGTIVSVNPLTFSSEAADPVIGLNYFNWRHLNMIEGRWISRDPFFDFSFGKIFDPKQRQRGTLHMDYDYNFINNSFMAIDVNGLARTHKTDQSVCEIARENGWQGSNDAGFVCYNGDTYMCVWNGAAGTYSKGINECIVEHEDTHLNNGDVETCKPCDQKRAQFPPGTTRQQANDAECKAYVASFKCLKNKMEENCGKLAEPAKTECQKEYCAEMKGKSNEVMLNSCLNSSTFPISHQDVPPCGKIWFPR